MSQENVETVKTALDAMAQQGLDAFAEYWTDDVEWRAVEGALDDRGPLPARTPAVPTFRTASTHSTS